MNMAFSPMDLLIVAALAATTVLLLGVAFVLRSNEKRQQQRRLRRAQRQSMPGERTAAVNVRRDTARAPPWISSDSAGCVAWSIGASRARLRMGRSATPAYRRSPDCQRTHHEGVPELDRGIARDRQKRATPETLRRTLRHPTRSPARLTRRSQNCDAGAVVRTLLSGCAARLR